MCSKLYGLFKVFWSHQFKEFRYNFERNSYVYFYWKKQSWYIPRRLLDDLSKLKSTLCPIKLFKKYIEATKIKESKEKFVFRQICHIKQGFKLKDLDKTISYTTVRDIWLKNLKNIGLDKTQFGLHSVRSGEATAAANFGIIDRLFQKHGRWRSENVKNGYVHENLSAMLSVSKNLGFWT